MKSEFSDESRRKLETIITGTMESVHAPGLSIALVRDGEVMYAEGFGARNVERNLPATPNTLYGIGSCTKSFTALAVMQLVEEGKLDLSDPVGKHLPFELGFEDDPVTLHHLLSMSSGIPSLGMAGILIERMTGVGESWVPMTDMDDFLLFVNGAREEVAARPAQRYFYLNTGFTLLGEVVERVSGTPYEDYVAERILRPLGMGRSTFEKEAFEKDPDAMTAYRKEKDGSLTPTVHPFHRLIYGPGGLLSPVSELTNYLIMNMEGGAYEGERLVDPGLLKEMHTGHTDRGTGMFGRNMYGYGWGIVEDFLGHELVTHSGSTGVSSAILGFIPDLKIGVAAASNIGGFGYVIPHAALALLMGKDLEKDIPYLAEEKDLQGLTGEYEAYKGTNRVSVVKKGALLFAESKSRWSESSLPLIPENRAAGNRRFNVYLPEGGLMPIEFAEGLDGRVDLYMERWRLYRKGK
jgi:CubicO group peptidase (beta-lactamase class C family)